MVWHRERREPWDRGRPRLRVLLQQRKCWIYTENLYLCRCISHNCATLFLEQSGQWKKRITAALVCMGIPEAVYLPLDWQHERQPEREKSYIHQVTHYRYLSWVAPNESQYNQLSSLPYFHDGPLYSPASDPRVIVAHTLPFYLFVSQSITLILRIPS
jgi:hypothetical protein